MPDEWTRFKDAATLIETKIGHELNLIGQRMTWLVLLQSFLFAAWINIADAHLMSGQFRTMLYSIVGTIGFCSALLALIATRAALLVGDLLLHARRSAENGLRRLSQHDGRKLFPPLGTYREGSTRGTQVSGAVAAAFLPPLFVGAWVAIGIQSSIVVEDTTWATFVPIGLAPLVGVWMLSSVRSSSCLARQRRKLEKRMLRLLKTGSSSARR